MAHVYRSTEDHNRILSKVAAYAANYLAPEGFTYTPPTEGGYLHKLVGPNEATLYLGLVGDTKGDRITVSGGFNIGTGSFGDYGKYVCPNSGVPSDITVALSRGETAVAMEIRRRYLPVYLTALAKVRCSNCNKAYGDHFGTDCQRDGGGKGFLPVAMERLQGTDLLTRYKRALEGLTPGGSEFVDDPERCAENVRSTRVTLMRMVVRRTKQVHELERELASTRSVELRGAYAMLESASSYLMNSCCSAYAHRDALTILVQAKRAVRKELQGL